MDQTKKEQVFKTVHDILQKYGTVKERNKRYSLVFALSYKDKMVNAQNIKVEINKRTFGSQYEIKNYLGIAMHVMVKQDMAAHKLVAMHERLGVANRDIFDVHFFLKNNWPVNQDIIKLRTGLNYKNFIDTCIDELEHTNTRGILSGLGELVTEKQKTWIKTNLLSDTIFLLKQARSS